MRAAVAISVALMLLTGAPRASAADSGYRFARSLAKEGPRPAASGAERSAHLRIARRFRDAGLGVHVNGFRVPGLGRSRNVVGVSNGPRRCLTILMAHTDSVRGSPGAVDNASGVGVLVALAPRLRALRPGCDVWLVATGAEERATTGRPNHLGASALLRRVRRRGRTDDLRLALSLDEVGRGRDFWLRSNGARVRPRVEGRVLRAARAAGASARWVRDAGSGNSDHREFQLAGLPAAKLGQPSNPCRHAPCDRAGLLQPGTFRLVRRALERVLR